MAKIQTTKLRDQRRPDELRPLQVTYDELPFAGGSVLFSMGNTKVLCSVMMQSGVPPFLKGQKRGWLTADYAMLPASTPTRSPRDILRKNGRSVEISRLIGRALRSVVNLDSIGENTIYIDCDVMCADGGTRCAALCGAFLALKAADSFWQRSNVYKGSILTDEIAALSVGIVEGEILVDIDCAEDNKAQADFNIVVTKSGSLIEIQGGAEAEPIGRGIFESVVQKTFDASKEIFAFYDEHPYRVDERKDVIVCSSRYEP